MQVLWVRATMSLSRRNLMRRHIGPSGMSTLAQNSLQARQPTHGPPHLRCRIPEKPTQGVTYRKLCCCKETGEGIAAVGSLRGPTTRAAQDKAAPNSSELGVNNTPRPPQHVRGVAAASLRPGRALAEAISPTGSPSRVGTTPRSRT